jgi:hypothetical protein
LRLTRGQQLSLWMTKIPRKKIIESLNMNETGGLRSILANAKQHPLDPIKKKSKLAGRPSKASLGPS